MKIIKGLLEKLRVHVLQPYRLGMPLQLLHLLTQFGPGEIRPGSSMMLDLALETPIQMNRLAPAI